jgi:hypothetical protein
MHRLHGCNTDPGEGGTCGFPDKSCHWQSLKGSKLHEKGTYLKDFAMAERQLHRNDPFALSLPIAVIG